MLSYRIIAINNHTHDVTIRHDNGREARFTVPPEHRALDLKKAFIENQALSLTQPDTVSEAQPDTVSAFISPPLPVVVNSRPPWYIRLLKWLRII